MADSLEMAGESGDDRGGRGEQPFPLWGEVPCTFLMPGIHPGWGHCADIIVNLPSPTSACAQLSQPVSSFSNFTYLFYLSPGTEKHILPHKAGPVQLTLDSLPHPMLRSVEEMG